MSIGPARPEGCYNVPMGLLSILLSQPLMFLFLVVPLLYSVIAHEVAHGVVALLFGDDTAKRRGRLTLNPISHLDPVGSLMLFIVGFGWAKPVPVNYGRLKNTRIGFICVALAGIVVNIILATLSVAWLHSLSTDANPYLVTVLKITAQINVTLAAFNLIPIPPLDGSRVIMALLPEKHWSALAKIEPYGFGLLILLVFTGFLSPVIAFVQDLVFALIQNVLGRF
jgi:Zn-dependent protease